MLIKTLFSVIFFVIFCPITLKLKSVYFSCEEKTDKKIFFSICLYNLIKVFSGYITLEKKCVAIHLTNKKAILIYPSDLLDTGAKYKKLKNFEVYEIKNVIEIGNNVEEEQLYFVFLVKNIVLQLGIYYKNKKDFAFFRNDFILNEQTEGVNIFLATKVVFNLFAILVVLFKKILENLYAKKQTN